MARANPFDRFASAPAMARCSRMNAHEYANVCFNAAGKAVEFVTTLKRRNDPAGCGPVGDLDDAVRHPPEICISQ
jgi:hypothetical protein